MTSAREGAAELCGGLEDAGARCVFGLPGTPAVALFDALRESGLRTVRATHELGAGFMANGYARVSGRVGILVTSPGPGFAYAIPALAEARLDSAALLHVAVKPSLRPDRHFQHQVIPQASMVEDLVKDVVEVDAAAALREECVRAHALALEGEPGPVVLHVSERALDESTVPDVEGGSPGPAGGVPEIPSALIERVLAARKPIVFAGAGALLAAEGVRALVERLPAPIFTTPSGRGLLPEDHPLALGFDPVRGGVETLNELLTGCDLVLALGCKLSHAGTAGFELTLDPSVLAHVNTDARALGANYATDLPVHAPAGSVVDALLQGLEEAPSGSTWTSDRVAEWRRRIGADRPEGEEEPAIPEAPGGDAAGFFAALREALPRRAVVVTDSGLHQILVRRHFRVLAPGGLLMPTDFASMGFGVPAAAGVALAAPERPVVAVVGDGGFAMAAMELLTAVRDRLPIVVIVFNDGYLNLIRLQQIRGYGRSHAVDVGDPDLEALAGGLGVAYARWEGDGKSAIDAALGRDRPTVVEVEVRDSAAIRSQRVRGAARATARNVLGPRVISRLKELVGRR